MTPLISAGLTALLIIVAALGLDIAKDAGVVTDADERITGVIIGILLAWTGNAMPKRRAECDGCDPSAGLALRRFAGWLFVMAGAAHAVIWLVAPIELANGLAICVVVGTLAVVLLRALVLRTFT